ncbi:hypothetical protein C4572_02835 [Candidatus Parcubacteria bacterium]|nr:MAG: hypothetical protein C4572_02835 [Candidatus Parcubacteria bacterium]
MSILSRDPRFLNLEYLFALLLDLIRFILFLIKKVFLFIISLSVQTYLLAFAGFLAVMLGVVAFKIWHMKHRRRIYQMVKFKEDEKLPKDRSNKWKQIKEKLKSENEEDWKEAIVMADGILDDIFAKIGIKGDGLAEKLKFIEPGDFESMQDVWEAYKVRSRIAREGAEFKISNEEAAETLAKYEKGLKELKYL